MGKTITIKLNGTKVFTDAIYGKILKSANAGKSSVAIGNKTYTIVKDRVIDKQGNREIEVIG